MKNKVFSCMYDFVQQYPDSPLSVTLIVNASDCSEREVKSVFDELRSKGLLKKKNFLSHVFTLTDEGLQTVKEGWEDYNRFRDQDDKGEGRRNIAS